MAPPLELARLEFALLALLAEQRLEANHPELAYVPSADLVRKLDFESRLADSENLRELIRRVRKKLQAQGVRGLIESRQRVGYRLACSAHV